MISKLRRAWARRACFAFALLSAAAGCASARNPKAKGPDPAPSCRPGRDEPGAAAFELGREAALNGDFSCARDYFDRAVETVRPARSNFGSRRRAFAPSRKSLYEAILRYEALAAPPEETASAERPVAPEPLQRSKPRFRARKRSPRRVRRSRPTRASATYDIPIVVNEAVLRFVAMFQNDLHDVIGARSRPVPGATLR